MPTTTAYPGALDDLDADLIPGSGANADAPLGQDGAGAYTHPDHHAVMADAIEALEAKVGTGASTPTAGTVLTGTATGVASWEPALRKATVTLSSADILDLHNTPITLVAAPGAGKYLVPHKFVAYFSAGTVEYLSGDTPVVLWYWGSESKQNIADVSGLTSTLAVTAAAGTVDASAAVNVALNAGATDAITTGDGTLTVTVWYSIEDVP